MAPWVLPAVNASLNGLATVLLIVGFVLIKRKQVHAHKRVMLGAFAVSAVFLVTYVTDKAIKGGAHTSFNAEGAVRAIYYAMLISHVVLAMFVPVLAIMLIRWGVTRQFEKHRRLARWAYPVWLYVSITGVLIFLALYVLNPAPGHAG